MAKIKKAVIASVAKQSVFQRLDCESFIAKADCHGRPSGSLAITSR
jgi:hypothetical protein